MKNKIFLTMLAGVLLGVGCKKTELDVKNPNLPGPADAQTESGIKSLALGVVYWNGFNGVSDSRYTGSFLGSSYFFLAPAYHDLLADVVSAEAANNITNQVGVPDYVILDNGTKLTSAAPAKAFAKSQNSRTKAGSNMFYYEWGWMYFLNNGCNNVLDLVDKTTFTADADSKKNAIKAWCYFWKGYVYAHIGSLYYAGLIKDNYTTDLSTNSDYKTSAEMIAASNANFDKAITALNAVTNAASFASVMGTLIPSQNQTGKGGVMTTAMFIRNINTMKARNVLVNKRVKDMTAADWTSVLTLSTNGINSTDLVFTGRSSAAGSYLSATGGSVAALTTGSPASTTYKVSERLIQEYNPTDKRLTNNFVVAPIYLNQKGGITYSTRYRLVDSGGVNKTYTSASVTSKVVGQYELYMAGSYEENELMKAEANIKLGNVALGLTSLDNVRTYQQSGLAAISGVVTDPALAYEELRKERRIALLFRQLSLYDARRWGVLDDISAGGGRTNAVVIDNVTGAINTKATINYNFPDYWDVPDDETSLNPPSATSAPVKNPK